MYRRSYASTTTSSKDELRIPAFESLSVKEQRLRSSLEEKVRTAFYSAGMALIEINELRLYRSTHLSFERGGRCFASSLSNHAIEEFCLDVFSFSSDYAYLKMAAARVYQNLLDNLPTNGRHFPLPTRQRQLRSIVKAKLSHDAQVEVWSMAIALAEGKVPSSSIVTEAVNLYLYKNDTQLNSLIEGEICQIVVRGNSKLKGLGSSWCIVEEVGDGKCIVNTWNNQLEVPVDNLEPQKFDKNQYQAIEDLGVRMTKLHQTGRLDKAALWVLNGLAKLDEPYLTTLEEKLLQVLEDVYLFHDVE